MINKRLLTLITFFVAAIIYVSCRRDVSCEGCRETHKAPIANAGLDTIIVLPLDSVLLDGRASKDPDGSISEWLWKKISGPSSFVINSPHSAKTSVRNLVTGIYQFELTVTDDAGLSAKDTVQVIVNTDGSFNRPPVANAGADQTIILPINTGILDGNASSDPDNNIIAYRWTNISGPSSFTIANPDEVQTQVSGLVKGLYQFELKVTDAGGLFSKDTIQIIVASQQSACDIDGRPVIQARLVPIGKLSIGKIDVITAAANNKIVFAGGTSYYKDSTGIPIRRVDVYDINSNSWSTKDLYQYPTWRVDMGIAVANNKIFIAGGGFWGDDLFTNRVDIYDASNNSWSVTELSESRSATAGVSAENKVFFAGGFSFNNGSEYWSNTVDIYDDGTKTSTTGTLSERRGYITAVASGNKIYFAGGQKNDGQLLVSDRIDEYDLVTNSWSISTLHEPLAGLTAISAGNKVFFAGGYSNSGESGTVEIRDVVTGATSFDCIIPRTGLIAVVKDDKIVFFTGSGPDSRNGTHFEIYDLTTGIWYTGLLDKSITRAAVISVDNVIYVAGGYVNGAGSDQVWKLEF